MATRHSYYVATRKDKTSTFKGGIEVQGDFSFGDAAADALTLTGLTTVATDQKIQFRDTGLYINSGADGKLTISADGTSTDDITLDGTVTVSDDLVMAADKDIGMSGTGTVTTGTGAIALNGDTTLATAKTLAVTDADALTVGGVIVPQETVVTAYLDASTVDGNIFIADDAWVVTSIEAAWTVASTSGTLMVDKCTGTDAPGAGSDMLTGTIDMSGTANTVTAGTLHGTAANYTLADGDRIAIDIGGTMTNLAGGVVTIHMKRA